jgi:hypothetical protein
MDMLKHWIDLDDSALERLQWYVRVTNVDNMPPGEVVDWPTDRPQPSTVSEPVTAAWYGLGLPNFLDLFDPRLLLLERGASPGPTPSPRLSPTP